MTLICPCKIQIPISKGNSVNVYFVICLVVKRHGSQFNQKPLNCQSQQVSSALSSACDFKSHFCKQCGPRSDCSRSNLIRVHTVCLYAKNTFEKFARIFSR